MVDDVIHGKVAMIERCLARVREDYLGHETEFVTEYMRQDAIILNLLRTCEAAIDLAMRVVRKHRLGLPERSRDAFDMLENAGLLEAALASRMRSMVGFRNVAVHAYQELELDIVRAVIERHLEDFEAYASRMLDLAGS